MKRIMLVGLLGGALLASTGCCGMGYRTCGPCGGGFGPCACEEPCDDGCTPCVPRRMGICDDCGCDPCGCGRCWYRGPLSCLFYWFTPGHWCGPNCGERYWGDFYSDPPDCYDPCDCHGNYMGGGTSFPGDMGAEYYEGGCPHCGRSMPSDGAVSSSERVISTRTRTTNQPHRAARR